MDRTQKRQKPHQQPEQQIQDRISSLPDAILCHILSFLPTKHAVATAVLSPRWKYLFTSLTHLDFDDSLIQLPSNQNPNKHINYTTFAAKLDLNFVKFVYRVLLHRNVSHVIKFRLKCFRDYDSDHINAWISNVICHKVEELDIHHRMRKSNILPSGLFSCGTLVDLKLCCNVFLEVPSDVLLPNLKNLCLQFVEFADDDTITELFSGCPVLVNLVIDSCKINNISVLDISVATLESLTVICRYAGEFDTEFCSYEVIFDVPKLKYLKYHGYVAEGYSLKSLGSVVEAEIGLELSGNQMMIDHLRAGKSGTYSEFTYNLITKISDVRFLYLSAYTMEALDIFWRPTIFPNLTHLELGASIVGRWNLLLDVLESSLNLEQLVFKEGLIDWNTNNEIFRHVPEMVPLCLSLHIKEIVIRKILGKKDELEMVEYFLKNAKVLEKMKIHSNLPSEEKLCLSQKFLTFPRCSEACQVVLT